MEKDHFENGMIFLYIFLSGENNNIDDLNRRNKTRRDREHHVS